MNWTELFIATSTASLVGSLHCVGMCGPFAMMATHTPNQGHEGTSTHVRQGLHSFLPHAQSLKTLAYHFGRLTTYLILGVIAGWAGTLINRLGDTVGWTEIAAKLVGLSMIGFGLIRLMMMRKPSRIVQHSPGLALWTKRILSVGKILRSTSPYQKAYFLGLITTWLPCGWLYLFALASSSTGSISRATWMMFAFWLGTIPLLSLLALGGQTLGSPTTLGRLRAIPVLKSVAKVPLQGIVALLMISFGVYTSVYRSQISLNQMVSPVNAGELSQTSIAAFKDEPLPCCTEGKKQPNRESRSKMVSGILKPPAETVTKAIGQ